MNDNLLLNCALSSLVHGKVYGNKVGNSTELNVASLHKCMFVSGPVSKVKSHAPNNMLANSFKTDCSISENDPDADIPVYFVDLTGQRTTMNISENYSIAEIKTNLGAKMNRPVEEMSFIYSGNRLNEPERLAADYNIQKYSTVHVMPVAKNADPIEYHLSAASLAPNYHYDFRKITADTHVYNRGGLVYQRPVGHMRYAIEVLNQYPDGNQWLGVSGRTSQTASAPGEWIVSYHGTTTNEFESSSMPIDGYKLSKSEKKTFTDGIYTTPNLKIAEKYGQRFEFEGATYVVILQNRVNPNTVEKLGNGTYYLSPNQNDVRPYGICVKKL